MSTATHADPASLLANLTGAFDHAPWAVTELAEEANIVRYANAAFCQLIDKSREDIIGKPFHDLLPHSHECLSLLDRVFRTGAAAHYTADERGAPSPLLFSYHLWPVMADGRTAGVMIQVNETGPLHDTRRAISQALLLGALHQDELIEAADAANGLLQIEISKGNQRERDARMLTNEVTHRVKNNLQVIAALIATEIKRTPAPWVEGYRAMQDRIMSISRLYDLMSQSSHDRTVALDAYLAEIAATLSTSMLGDAPGIRIAIEAEGLVIETQRAMPFGLLVNELCTNALKHAFPDGVGLVTLSVRRIGDDIELRVADDGTGAAARNLKGKPGKHGSDYVTIFVRQLRGVLVRSATPSVGTAVTVRFPMSPDPEAVNNI